MRVFSFVCFCSLALVVPSCSDESTSSPCARCPSGTHCESGRCVTDDAELTEIEDEADDADVEADQLEHEVDVELVDEETAPDSVDGEESELIEELDEADEQELPDPTGRRCNTQVPCPDGFVCEEGVCAIDCHGNARCTSVCCAEGELCYLGQCTTPGEACGAVAPTTCGALGSCPPEQQCDPSLERCMPIPQSTTCEYRPSADFAPQELWHWEGFSENPAFGHAIATPAVADLNGDGVSDIVVPVTAHVPGTPTVGGILCALSGPGDCDGGPAELWCTPPTGPLVNWVASPAIADLDGDGALTIIAGAARGNPMVYGIVGYTAEGELIPDFGTHEGNPVDVMVFVGAPAVADLDGDGSAEVFVGFTVFDSEGHLLWSKAGATGNGSYGPLTVAVDLDGVPGLELVGGNMAYHASGSEAWGPTADARGFADGWPAIADFDLDGHAEVAVISQGILRIFDRHGMLFSSNHGQVEGHGGPPTIADFDGDGRPDIAIASRNALTVFRVGDDLEHTISPLWSTSSRDFSSNFTGVSVFDFDGNGLSEVIYGDECYVRVYEGPGDGLGGTRTLFEVPNTSCTGTEYPVVADVTGDGRAEFIVVANNAENMATACSPYVTQCRTAYPGYTPRHGVTVYRDAKDNWVSTLPIWNQHSYHVT
ncbi:MAG: FG-GAP-like repeat-containing protein, partial [Myxococcota bacterium]|nr:FG-GAP-like repeat-containing protein [Myxococcota bacterium]